MYVIGFPTNLNFTLSFFTAVRASQRVSPRTFAPNHRAVLLWMYSINPVPRWMVAWWSDGCLPLDVCTWIRLAFVIIVSFLFLVISLLGNHSNVAVPWPPLSSFLLQVWRVQRTSLFSPSTRPAETAFGERTATAILPMKRCGRWRRCLCANRLDGFECMCAEGDLQIDSSDVADVCVFLGRLHRSRSPAAYVWVWISCRKPVRLGNLRRFIISGVKCHSPSSALAWLCLFIMPSCLNSNEIWIEEYWKPQNPK